MLAIGAVGFLYTLVQIPFAVYYVCTEKRLIRNGCLPIFDFYGDIVRKSFSFFIFGKLSALINVKACSQNFLELLEEKSTE